MVQMFKSFLWYLAAKCVEIYFNLNALYFRRMRELQPDLKQRLKSSAPSTRSQYSHLVRVTMQYALDIKIIVQDHILTEVLQ